MNAELIAVGTEMLLGQIVNTNAAYLARTLAHLGIGSRYQQVVGDNQKRLDGAITVAEKRSDIIVLMGGLGPTPDDLTKQTLAAHLGRELVTDANHHDKLVAMAKRKQQALTPNNLVQAMLPSGATPLTNHNGLAVGAFMEDGGHRYVLLPGPPREFKMMVDKELVPLLAGQQQQVLASETMHFFGLGESALVTEIGDIIAEQGNPTVAPYIGDYEVELRLTARADNDEDAQAMIAPMRTGILQRIGQYYYGSGDKTLAAHVVHALEDAGATITAAESLTAGAFQSALGSVAGASNVLNGGFVTYAPSAKEQLVGVDADVIASDGVVSAATAQAMATGAQRTLGADIGVGLTGVAGPDGLEGHPAGTVWIGLAVGDHVTATEFHFQGSRNDVRGRAVKSALLMVLQALKK
ncbi:competence damage-inducible protein a [Lacticaseibacillus pantheris DSM 15945 = JCM 12539 = NBRC 106106]|uniref:Putative competence-damage inducible protein n=1 Tax=Lacticaseibacillus pantheris DSM 15945 = JCM 12539 = NBRC 106106 TaxID=1423783 RepID=A0A0R1TYZ1_9LACO|nr:competence/damage-inducible protein A [Lacticaseibacillus pantheris]KRL86448.1 competence damage-inducible protein a [Lacticaseibacillus pantheris DSM 15945 = JCM 12539 = NBRC 106106]